MFFLCGAFASTAELSVEEWNKKKQEFDNFLIEHQAAVDRGEALPIKCLTPWVMELQNSMPKALVDIEARAVYTTVQNTTYNTANFTIHYADTGSHRPYLFDEQDSVAGVPNFVYNTGLIAEKALLDYLTMGYDPPLSDAGQNPNGGDGRFDIYLYNLGTVAYGITYTDGNLITDSTASAYMILDNDYQGFGYADRLDPVRVTFAHEFFHAIQFGYDIGEAETTPGSINYSWGEMSAVFMEEMHYDNINDYLLYLPYFYDYPQWSLRFGTYATSGILLDRNFHMYGCVVWPLFLNARFPSAIDESIIREIWDSCRVEHGFNWLRSTNNIIKSRTGGTDSLATIFSEFAIWNLFTDTRARIGEYFEEAAAFDRVVEKAATVTSYPTTVEVPLFYRPDNLGANYIFLENVSEQLSGLQVTFSPNEAYYWTLQIVGLPADPANDSVWIDPNLYTADNQIIPIPNAADFEQIVLIPAVVNSNDSTVYYSMVVSPLGDGVFSPAGGERWYAGETHRISWMLADSTLAIDIEYSTDSGSTWTNIHRVPNQQYNYDWLIPTTPSNQCFVRIVDAENSNIADTSGMFSILVPEGTIAKDPYPNPAWMHMIDAVSFKAIVEATAEDPTMKVTILNLTGEKINDMLPSVSGVGELIVEWDFKNNDGELVAAGPYLAVIELNGQTTVKKFMVLR